MDEAEKAPHTTEPLIRTIAGESFVPIDDYNVIKQQREELLAAAEYALLELRNPARRITAALALGISVLRGAIAKHRGQ